MIAGSKNLQGYLTGEEELLGTDILPPGQSFFANFMPQHDSGFTTLEQYIVFNHETESVPVYRCSYENCGKIFNAKQKIQRHMYTHTGEKPFACRFCDHRSSRKDKVKGHEISKHFNEMMAMRT